MNIHKNLLLTLAWFITLSLALSVTIPTPPVDPDPDMFKTFKEIVIENGYGFESFKVMTEDGYILTLFRIGMNTTY